MSSDSTVRAGGSIPEDSLDEDWPDQDEVDLAPPALGWLLLVAGLVGALASFILTVDKIQLLEDPNYVPGCSISAEFSCGSVMSSWQASLFGIPNSLIGLVTYPVLAAIGGLVIARVQLPRWVWWSVQVGVLFGVVMVHWLVVHSVYVIGTLCLYCMAVWLVTIPAFWFVTGHTIGSGSGRTYPGYRGLTLASQGLVAGRWSPLIPVAWIVALAVLIVVQLF